VATNRTRPRWSSRTGTRPERLYTSVCRGSNRNCKMTSGKRLNCTMGNEHSRNSGPTRLTTQEDDALAEDLVLGILPDAEREAAERREAAEPDFAQLVSAWRQRLELLPDPVEPVVPPKGVWDRIAALIGRK